MAGHSKFKNIMHRKGAQDARRAKIFAKLAREITVAAKIGGEEPAMNARLRSAVAAAKAQNMPNENIQRAVSKAIGGGEGTDFAEVRYEGYGPKGIAVIVEALTDNRNRTASEIRSIFSKFGGALGETGSVSFLFDRIGVVSYRLDIASDEEMFDASIELGARDLEHNNNNHEIICNADNFSKLRDGLEKIFGVAESTNLEWRAQNLVSIEEEEAAIIAMKFVETLDDNDDVQQVSINLEIDDHMIELFS